MWTDGTDVLMHHGILGQKWGIRRFQNPDGTLTEAGKKRYISSTPISNDLSVLEVRNSKLQKFLASKSKKIAEESSKSHDYRVVKNGKEIGEFYLYDEAPNSTNITWISIHNKERGKGYAQQVMNYIIKSETQNGKEYITLEVPGDSKDARHIYEKYGFVPGEKLTSDDDVWGGLTAMKKKL